MAETAILHVQVDINSKAGQDALKVLRGEVVITGQQMQNIAKGTGLSWTNLWSKVQLGMTAFNAVKGAVTGLLGPMIQGASQIENYSTQFEVLLGDSQLAGKMLDELKQKAASTPFEFKDLASSMVTMKQFNLSTESLMGNIDMLSNVAMGDSEKLKSLTLAFSQIQSAGKLAGQDLLQLINAGFNPLSVISEKTGKSIGELKKEMENGAISAQMVTDAFKVATSEGGAFYGMNEKMSKTFTGLMSTMKDNLTAVATALGTPIMEGLKGGLGAVIAVLEKPEVQAIFGKLATAIGELMTHLGAVFEFIAPVIMVVVDVLGQLMPPIGNLIKALMTALKPVLTFIVGMFEKLAPVLAKLINTAAKLVEALEPVIDILLQLAEENLEQLIPLLDAMLNLLIALTPAITIIGKITAGAVLLYTKAIQPIISAITYIIEVGAKAADMVATIFGAKAEKGVTAKSTYAGKDGPKGAAANATGTLGGGGTGEEITFDTTGGGKGKSASAKKKDLQKQMEQWQTEMWLEGAEERMLDDFKKAITAQLSIKREYVRQVKVYDADAEREALRVEDEIRLRKAEAIDDEIEREREVLKVKLDMLALEFMTEAEYVSKKEQLERESQDRIRQMEQERIASYVGHMQNALTNIGTLAGENFAAQKSIAIAQALINSYMAYTKTVGELGFFAIPLALLTLAASLKQVDEMKKVSPGKRSGGMTSPNQLYHINEGNKPEFVVNADATARNRALLSAINAGMTVGEMTGGSRYGVPSTGPSPLRIVLGGEFRFEDGAVRAQIERDLLVSQGGSL